MAKALPYRAGDWFAIPLRDHGYAIGLAARDNGRAKVLGYFFGPRRNTLPTLSETALPARDEAVLVAMCGDLGLISGEWPVILRPSAWRPEEWPVPAFGHIDAVDPAKAYRRVYNEVTLNVDFVETPISPEEALRLPSDGQYGSGAIEIVLTRLLS